MGFYNGKRVFITGHTGFKGSWLCKILEMQGAEVTGYSLEPPTTPNLFELTNLESQMDSVIGDVRDFDFLMDTISNAQPEIVIHLAAQPIVKQSYKNPRETFETNIMGVVNLLECVRQLGGVKSLLNVTTDKVYENKEWEWGYRENEPLDGFDPYSNSKSCSELVTHCYYNSFFQHQNVPISTARAGNVIGGGDFAIDRIIPDCVRAAHNKQSIIVRNPFSIRPYQHVLEPLCAYLTIIEKQYKNPSLSGWYNVGPEQKECITTGELADIFCECWGEGQTWENHSVEGPHEANFLKLDCSKIKKVFNWSPRWDIQKAIEKTVELSKCYLSHGNVVDCMEQQIKEYFMS